MSGIDEPSDERIFAGDPRYDGFRVQSLWVLLVVDPQDDQEGIVYEPGGLRLNAGKPCIATDERAAGDLRDYAEFLAGEHPEARLRLVRLDLAEEVASWRT